RPETASSARARGCRGRRRKCCAQKGPLAARLIFEPGGQRTFCFWKVVYWLDEVFSAFDGVHEVIHEISEVFCIRLLVDGGADADRVVYVEVHTWRFGDVEAEHAARRNCYFIAAIAELGQLVHVRVVDIDSVFR